MNIKGLSAAVAIGVVVTAFLSSVSMAEPEMRGDSSPQVKAAAMNARIQHRLEQLSQRLEIKASQQSEWEEYARSVSMLEDRNWKRPDKDADAAAIAHFRADRATVLAKELTAIAETTDKLQKVLTEDQRKIFNEVSRLSMREARERMHHGPSVTDGKSRGEK